MKKTLLALLALFILFSACKKSDNSKPDQPGTDNAKLIVGKWLQTKLNIKVSNPGGTLVKDTTIDYTTVDNKWSSYYFIFNADGSAYVTSLPYTKKGSNKQYSDTTSYLTYKISGKTLLLTELGIAGSSETHSIIQLNSSILEMTNSYNSQPNSDWGLDQKIIYKFTADSEFSKQ